MLPVAALQVGDPVEQLILMEPYDSTFQTFPPSTRCRVLSTGNLTQCIDSNKWHEPIGSTTPAFRSAICVFSLQSNHEQKCGVGMSRSSAAGGEGSKRTNDSKELDRENPFDGELALQNSNYLTVEGGRPAALTGAPCSLLDSAMAGAFRGFIQAPTFSCVGAKSAVACENYRLGIYDRLGSEQATAGLAHDLFTFTREADMLGGEDFVTFAALFREPAIGDEAGFEDLLWRQLRALNSYDAPLFEWDPAVSSDPENPHFSFSFAGRAFFIVGLHPHSSRQARRFPWPALVFNPHEQFVRLREEGRWERFQQIIRAREKALQGSLNPNLSDYGTITEARQYSGRQVERDWRPPFEPGQRCPFGH